MLKIIPNKKNIGAEIIVNLKEITNKALEGGKEGVMQINHERKKNNYK